MGPPWRQPRDKWMVSLVNSHTNATLKSCGRLTKICSHLDPRVGLDFSLGQEKRTVCRPNRPVWCNCEGGMRWLVNPDRLLHRACNTTSGRDCVKSLRLCLHGTCPHTPPHAPVTGGGFSPETGRWYQHSRGVFSPMEAGCAQGRRARGEDPGGNPRANRWFL